MFGRALFVVRAPVRTPAVRAGWRFWDGRSWQPDPAGSAPVLAAAGGVSQTLSVHPVGGGFVAVLAAASTGRSGHPEIRLGSGRLLIPVSHNTSDLRRLIDDPAVGRPRFAEVEQP